MVTVTFTRPRDDRQGPTIQLEYAELLYDSLRTTDGEIVAVLNGDWLLEPKYGGGRFSDITISA